MQSVFQRVRLRIRRLLRQPIPNFPAFLPCVSGRHGIEIGGPSSTFRSPDALPIYDRLGSLDNCDFSTRTVWTQHGSQFVYLPSKAPGRSFFCEGSHLAPVADGAYDFVLSCHNLEHFANPVRALLEWKRILRPGGALVLVLPYFLHTFDHRRTPTSLQHLWADYERGVGEDDLTHLPEILAKHDLDRDAAAGDYAAFEQRCRQNLHNRCMHHHVFDEHNSRELLQAVGFEVPVAELAGSLYLLGRLPQDAAGAQPGLGRPA